MSAALGGIAFWLSTRRDALKELLDAERDPTRGELEQELHDDADRMASRLESTVSAERRQREELEHQLYGNLIRN